jgi:hypothetical protein
MLVQIIKKKLYYDHETQFSTHFFRYHTCVIALLLITKLEKTRHNGRQKVQGLD